MEKHQYTQQQSVSSFVIGFFKTLTITGALTIAGIVIILAILA